MLGLGPGARSYTRGLHYSSEYAVSQAGVRGLLEAWAARPREAFAVADYGVRLDSGEQRRRYLLKSLLRTEGLDLAAYQAAFGSQALADFPELAELEAAGLARRDALRLAPTEAGLAFSDALGPWLYSPAVRALSQEFELR
jgi:oxygen-independent coproporphyrinogen-3 oxidase